MTTDPDMQKRIEAGPRIVALQKWNQANGCPIRLGADLYELLAAADAVDSLRVRVDTTPEPPQMPRCGLCGHRPTDHKGMRGLAGSVTVGDTEVKLCHEDDHSCYHRWTVYGDRPVGDGTTPESLDGKMKGPGQRMQPNAPKPKTQMHIPKPPPRKSPAEPRPDQCTAYLNCEGTRRRCRRQAGHLIGPTIHDTNALHTSDPLDHPEVIFRWNDSATGASYLKFHDRLASPLTLRAE